MLTQLNWATSSEGKVLTLPLLHTFFAPPKHAVNLQWAIISQSDHLNAPSFTFHFLAFIITSSSDVQMQCNNRQQRTVWKDLRPVAAAGSGSSLGRTTGPARRGRPNKFGSRAAPVVQHWRLQLVFFFLLLNGSLERKSTALGRCFWWGFTLNWMVNLWFIGIDIKHTDRVCHSAVKVN